LGLHNPVLIIHICSLNEGQLSEETNLMLLLQKKKMD